MLRDHWPGSAGVLLTLHTIATFMDKDGRAFPGQPAIARGARAAVRTVRRHVDAAVEEGWLHLETQRGAGKAWRRLVYFACVPEGLELSEMDQELRDVTLSQSGGVPDDTREHEDTIVSAPSGQRADSIVSAPSGDVRPSGAQGADKNNEGADTGQQKVRTQLVPTNSSLNSPENSSSEGPLARSAGRVIDATNNGAGQDGSLQHISTTLPSQRTGRQLRAVDRAFSIRLLRSHLEQGLDRAQVRSKVPELDDDQFARLLAEASR